MKRRKITTSILIILTLIAFCFMSLASGDGSSSSASKKGTGGGDTDTGKELPGTYFGVNGSILVLLPNGDADYFYKGWTELQHDNSWSYDSDNDKLFVYMKESALIGSYDVEAYLNGDISTFNLVASGGTLSQSLWDDETYYRYSDDANSFTASQCEDMIVDFVKNNPDVKTNIKESTPTPVPTKKPTATKPTTVQTASTEPTVLELDFPAVITYKEKIEFQVGGDYKDSIPYYEAKSGYEYLIVGVICNNNDSDDYFISDMNFQCYVDNKLVEVTYIIADGFESSATVASGRSAEIWFAYLVPTDSESIELEFKPDWLSSEKCIINVK